MIYCQTTGNWLLYVPPIRHGTQSAWSTFLWHSDKGVYTDSTAQMYRLKYWRNQVMELGDLDDYVTLIWMNDNTRWLNFYRAMLRRARLILWHSMSSVCPSVRDVQVPWGWNTSKIISRLVSLRFICIHLYLPKTVANNEKKEKNTRADNNMGDLVQRVMSTKPAISPCKIWTNFTAELLVNMASWCISEKTLIWS